MVELLKGFSLHDDGRKGERVTPTGAAILAHLGPEQGAVYGPERLAESGIGFVECLRKGPGKCGFLLYDPHSPSAAAGARLQ